MENEHGTGMTTALEKARVPMTGALTQPQAMHILKLSYPKAPEDQVIRAAIFCRDFGLHPLAREVFLIPFNEGKPNETWAMVVGIPANRKMAHALKGEFSFLDDTPRAAYDSEIEKQFGKNSEEASLNVISITKLKGVPGNLAIGFGLYSKTETPKGMDKGNTKRNQANIRSERQAMDRLPGPPIPKVEVVDERYIDMPEIGKVEKVTGEIVEGEARELPDEEPTPPAPAAKEHFCVDHNCYYELKTGRFGGFYAHKVEGGWCNEKKPKEKVKAQPEPAPELEPQPIEAQEFEALKPEAEAEKEQSDDLFTWIATNMSWKDSKSAKSWIVNVCKIPEDKIASDPDGVKAEIAQLQGWTV